MDLAGLKAPGDARTRRLASLMLHPLVFHGTDHHRPRARCTAAPAAIGPVLPVEVIVAAGMISLTCSVVMFVFTQLNGWP